MLWTYAFLFPDVYTFISWSGDPSASPTPRTKQTNKKTLKLKIAVLVFTLGETASADQGDPSIKASGRSQPRELGHDWNGVSKLIKSYWPDWKTIKLRRWLFLRSAHCLGFNGYIGLWLPYYQRLYIHFWNHSIFSFTTTTTVNFRTPYFICVSLKPPFPSVSLFLFKYGV